MLNITNILNRFKPDNKQEQPLESNQPKNVIKATKNWYEERFDKMVVQRNLLIVLLLLFTLVIIASIITVSFVVGSKRFDPFVIQIDDNTGVATVVNPASSEILSGNDALSRYFIKKYIIARETYNPVDFDKEARNIIRLFSSNDVFYNYLGYIRNKDIDPVLMYGKTNTTFLIVKSWSKVEQKKYMVRFSVNETAGNKRVFNKIVVISFDYVPMELSDAELDINPVGFQVKAYRVDDDNS